MSDKQAGAGRIKAWADADPDNHFYAIHPQKKKMKCRLTPMFPALNSIRCMAFIPGKRPQLVDVPSEEFDSLLDWSDD